MDKLTNDFEKSLFNDSIDIIEDYTEIGIDSFIEEGILKEIPFVRSIVSMLKIGKNIHDRNLLKQTLTFIKEFNSGNISKGKLIAYKSTIENNPQKCEEELGRVLILLNSYVDREKSIMLARLYKSYVMQEINWHEFCEFSEIINRLFIEDLRILKYLQEQKKIKGSQGDDFRLERLYSLGIVGNSYFADFNNLKDNFIEGRVLNSIGKKFCNIIF